MPKLLANLFLKALMWSICDDHCGGGSGSVQSDRHETAAVRAHVMDKGAQPWCTDKRHTCESLHPKRLAAVEDCVAMRGERVGVLGVGLREGQEGKSLLLHHVNDLPEFARLKKSCDVPGGSLDETMLWRALLGTGAWGRRGEHQAVEGC
jgi:hypothetical protein